MCPIGPWDAVPDMNQLRVRKRMEMYEAKSHVRALASLPHQQVVCVAWLLQVAFSLKARWAIAQ